MVYISDAPDNSASLSPSTSSEVHSLTIVDRGKAGLADRAADSPTPEDTHEVTRRQMTPDESRNKPFTLNLNPNWSTAIAKERRRVSTPAALPAKVLAVLSPEDEKKPLIHTSPSPPSASFRSQRYLVAPVPGRPLASDSSPPTITFGSKVHQNASFNLAAPASKGTPSPKLPGASGSLSAPASLCSDHHAKPAKAPPKAPKAGATKRRKTGGPLRKRARTSINLVNDENLPNTV